MVDTRSPMHMLFLWGLRHRQDISGAHLNETAWTPRFH
jgi:hypothetical protein